MTNFKLKAGCGNDDPNGPGGPPTCTSPSSCQGGNQGETSTPASDPNCAANNGNDAGANNFSVYTGNVFRALEDIAISGGVGNHQLKWERFGGSRTVFAGKPFGTGHSWRHSYQWELVSAGKSGYSNLYLFDLYHPDGSVNRFTQVSVGSMEYRSAPSVGDRIIQNGNTYTLQRRNGWRYMFDKLTESRAACTTSCSTFSMPMIMLTRSHTTKRAN
jgi:hypothetical protein